ncbi:MAG TPA: Gfo/Idh/MocA family oxidoreductase [Dehalococcoidia bacterium]|nr:Gfo/Idh/MocA family oxidoreductase [Dehalococcoidia bacterium]
MLRGALIGAGNIARNGHLPAYLRPELRERLGIVAVADLCPDNLAAIATLLPTARRYGDAATLLHEERPDFVDICAPPYAHRDLIAMAVASGCHVLCEKPLTTALDEALAIRALVQQRGLVAMPCHQYHYAPQWLTLRALIEAGEIGDLREAELVVERVGANAGAAGWQPLWRTREELACGGILVDHGAHLFYQLHTLFGSPQCIACRTERRLPGYQVDDTAAVELRYAAASARLRLTWAAAARRSTHRYTGTLGEIVCEDDTLLVRGERGERRIHFADALSKGSAHSDWFAPLLAEFAARVAARDSRLDLLDEAVIVAACFGRAYASAALDGEPVAWVDPLPAGAGSLAAAD